MMILQQINKKKKTKYVCVFKKYINKILKHTQKLKTITSYKKSVSVAQKQHV